MSPTFSRGSEVSLPAAGAAGLLILALAACATVPPQLPDELTGVPFFPQTIHQCGPAALATVLVHSGVATTPEALAPQVYLPGRRGSLQVELVAAARTHARVPTAVDGSLPALETALADGRPVLVLQDLGALGIRRWHFAVLVGIDHSAGHVVLRSGRERRRVESLARFERSWARGSRWAIVLGRPGEIPATASAADYVRSLSETDRHLDRPTADRAWRAVSARWPADPLALVAVANHALGAGRASEAIAGYRALLEVSPEHAAGRNNLANALLARGCVAEARREAARALADVPRESPLLPAIRATLEEANNATQDTRSTCAD